MRRVYRTACVAVLGWLLATTAWAESQPRLEVATDPGLEALGDWSSETPPPASKVLQDTIWIADWSFDAPGGGCTEAGWVHQDLRILNDGSNYWSVLTATCTGSKAATLRKHDLCWASDGYGNNWDYSIVLNYAGATATLSFELCSDSEPGFDFVLVEGDSLGLSESLVDYSVDPTGTPSEFRNVLFSSDGDNSTGITVASLALPDYGPGTHEVYIRFFSDGGFSDEDGDYVSLGLGLVVDNIAVTGGIAYTEDFECGDIGCLNPNVQLLNTAPATPFGEWGRLFAHITDNDKCTENTTCAWTWTDPTLIAFFPDMAFGPGSGVIRNWLDNLIVSPWASLASTPSATGTVLSFRRFPGNRFTQGFIVQGWRVRGKLRVDNTDTSAPGDSIDCVSPWGHASQFNSLNAFNWITSIFDMSPHFDPGSTEVQLSFRVTDWQGIAGVGPPATLNPGPGPYMDRVRIGRRVLSGPVINEGIDSRTQGQDCFPTFQNAVSPGQHFSPSTDRFGTCAFSMGTELGIGFPGSVNLITGDSITVDVRDIRGAGSVTSVKWYGAIVAGPHVGKAPAPYTVGANGFFETNADSMRGSSGNFITDRYTRDLDDTYFRGGDVLQYFWAATDAGGGFASMPAGMTALPASVAAAETATGGLHEVNFLPTINWDPAYVARIAAHATGDIDPTPGEIANSSQANCILYYQHTTSRRRSGPLQTTAFMRTLDELGYEGSYDIYDVQGYGNTNNQLGGRATVPQLTGYRLVIEDDGRSNLAPNITNGSNSDTEKVNQALFYRNWLANGLSSEAGTATLWVIGESTVFEKVTNPLFTVDFGISTAVTDQALALNPDVEGVANHTFTTGNTGTFTTDRFSLNGGCPVVRNYDGYTAGTGVTTHLYRAGATLGSGAVVMNSNATLAWNTIAMGFAWFDIRHRFGSAPGTPAKNLAAKVLSAVLGDCAEPLDPTGIPDGDVIAAPRATVLHPNVPNPFNPATKLSFDLAEAGRVRLEIYDVAGHRVRVALDASLPAGFGHSVTWNGLDDAGRRASSGVYLARLYAGNGIAATRRLVLLK